MAKELLMELFLTLLKSLKKTKKELMVLGDGNQKKPYIHVEDLIDCIFFIIKNSNKRFNEFNISSKVYESKNNS